MIMRGSVDLARVYYLHTKQKLILTGPCVHHAGIAVSDKFSLHFMPSTTISAGHLID